MTDTPAAPRSPPMTPPDLARGLFDLKALLAGVYLVAIAGATAWWFVVNDRDVGVLLSAGGAAPALWAFWLLVPFSGAAAARAWRVAWIGGAVLLAAAPVALGIAYVLASRSPGTFPSQEIMILFNFALGGIPSALGLALLPIRDPRSIALTRRIALGGLAAGAAVWLVASLGLPDLVRARAEAVADGRPHCLLEPTPAATYGYSAATLDRFGLVDRLLRRQYFERRSSFPNYHLLLVIPSSEGEPDVRIWSFRALGFRDAPKGLNVEFLEPCRTNAP